MRTKMLAVLATIAVAMVLGASTARADQITLGDSCSGSLTVFGTVNPTVGGSISACHGTWEQGATDTSITPWGSNGSTLTVTDSGTNTLTGTLNWTSYTQGSNTLDGFITVTSVTGFNNEYAVGGVYVIDLTFQAGTCTENVDHVAIGCRVSSGEIPTPEPGTLTLLGTGLLTMAGFLRRKLSA